MFKRIFLFMAVNVLVVLTISIVLNLLGVPSYMYHSYGMDYSSLLIFCAIWGFAGAFISLALSRFMAKMMMGVKVIDPVRPGTGIEQEILFKVHKLAKKAGMTVMPEVGIYQSPDVNAFATGPSKSRALVAVSTGLLNQMDNEAIEGVLGHEIAHITNGDMVTMTLIQGVINTFVMFLSRIAAWSLSQALSSNRDRESAPPTFMYYIIQILFEIFFSFFGMMVVAWFSRRREFRADAGSAAIAGREKMVHALQALKRVHGAPEAPNAAIASLQINGRKNKFFALFSTHPDLDDRINALRNLA